MLSSEEKLFYDRQLRLNGFGSDAQQRLKAAKVVIIGVGGLGCPAALYLAGVGVGTLGLVDADLVSSSNLHRQLLYSSAQVGMPKVDVARAELAVRNPFIEVATFEERLTPQNAVSILSQFDVVIDGSDNFETRYLVNDACIVLEKPFISGAIFEFEGQLGVFNALDSKGARSASYRCVYPEAPTAYERPSCAEIGVVGVVPGLIGTLQALEAIKLITGVGDLSANTLMILDLLQLSMRKLKIRRNEELCRSVTIRDSYTLAGTCVPLRQRGEEIMINRGLTPRELNDTLARGEKITLLDIRENKERSICHIGGTHVPMGEIAEHIDEIPRDHPVVVYCKAGGRSQRVIEMLERDYGFKNLVNLEGGVLRWSDEVDASITKY